MILKGTDCATAPDAISSAMAANAASRTTADALTPFVADPDGFISHAPLGCWGFRPMMLHRKRGATEGGQSGGGLGFAEREAKSPELRHLPNAEIDGFFGIVDGAHGGTEQPGTNASERFIRRDADR